MLMDIGGVRTADARPTGSVQSILLGYVLDADSMVLRML
jgi:hypothetical protein